MKWKKVTYGSDYVRYTREDGIKAVDTLSLLLHHKGLAKTVEEAVLKIDPQAEFI